MIRTYLAGDEAGINALFETVFSKKRSLTEWQWKFEKLGSHLPIIIVAEVDDQIVGHAACLLFEGSNVDGSPILIGERVDIMVHQDYQGRGIYQKIVKALIEESERQNVAYLYGFPAEKAKNIFIKMAQATDLGNINRYVSMNLPSLRQKSTHQLMKTLIETDLIKMSTVKGKPAIHVNRSLAFLTSRYMKHPSIDYYVYQSNSAYIIYRLDYLKSVIPVYTIVDILAEDELSIIKSFKKSLGTGIVSTWGIPNTPLEAALVKTGFKVHSSPMPFVVKTLTTHECGQEFNNWRILQGDVDSF